jgi:hypothetical protein
MWNWIFTSGIIVSWLAYAVVVTVVAKHRIDRAPGFRFETTRQMRKYFHRENYDEMGKRLVPLLWAAGIAFVVCILGRMILL